MRNIIIFLLTLMVTIHLAWDPNTESTVIGYKLYYGTSIDNYTTTIDVGNVVDYYIEVDEQYPMVFAVTAYSASSESGYSIPLVVHLYQNRFKIATNRLSSVTYIKVNNGVVLDHRVEVIPTLNY